MAGIRAMPRQTRDPLAGLTRTERAVANFVCKGDATRGNAYFDLSVFTKWFDTYALECSKAWAALDASPYSRTIPQTDDEFHKEEERQRTVKKCALKAQTLLDKHEEEWRRLPLHIAEKPEISAIFLRKLARGDFGTITDSGLRICGYSFDDQLDFSSLRLNFPLSLSTAFFVRELTSIMQSLVISPLLPAISETSSMRTT